MKRSAKSLKKLSDTIIEEPLLSSLSDAGGAEARRRRTTVLLLVLLSTLVSWISLFGLLRLSFHGGDYALSFSPPYPSFPAQVQSPPCSSLPALELGLETPGSEHFSGKSRRTFSLGSRKISPSSGVVGAPQLIAAFSSSSRPSPRKRHWNLDRNRETLPIWSANPVNLSSSSTYCCPSSVSRRCTSVVDLELGQNLMRRVQREILLIWARPINFCKWDCSDHFIPLDLKPFSAPNSFSSLPRQTHRATVSSVCLDCLRLTPPAPSSPPLWEAFVSVLRFFLITLHYKSSSILLFLDMNGRGLYPCRVVRSMIYWCGDYGINYSSKIQCRRRISDLSGRGLHPNCVSISLSWPSFYPRRNLWLDLNRGSLCDLILLTCPSTNRWSGDCGNWLFLTSLLIPAAIPSDPEQGIEFRWRDHIVDIRDSTLLQSYSKGLPSPVMSLNGNCVPSIVSSRACSWITFVSQPRYQSSFCRGQKRTLFPSFSKEKFVLPPSSTSERTFPPVYSVMEFKSQRSKLFMSLRAIRAIRSQLIALALDIDFISVISETFCQKFPVLIYDNYRYSILRLLCTLNYVASVFFLGKEPPFVT